MFENAFDIPVHPASPFTSFETLTTLHIDFLVPCAWWDVHSSRLHFPNLRVLALRHMECTPRSVYIFIHKHATLLEVALELARPIRLAATAILKLANGTGTWWFGPDAVPARFGAYTIPINPISTTIVHPEQDVDHSVMVVSGSRRLYMACDAFAWCRRPLYEYSTVWKSREGSLEPRYAVTELSLSLGENGMPDWQANVQDYMGVPDYFLIGSFCSEVRSLRLRCDTRLGPRSFASMIVCVLVWHRVNVSDTRLCFV